MLKFVGKDIYVNAGDDIELNVTVKCDGVPWALAQGDRLELCVYSLNDGDTQFEQTLKERETTFHIEGKHTKGLSRLPLAYKVSLLFANGKKETIIGRSPTNIPRFFVLEG